MMDGARMIQAAVVRADLAVCGAVDALIAVGIGIMAGAAVLAVWGYIRRRVG